MSYVRDNDWNSHNTTCERTCTHIMAWYGIVGIVEENHSHALSRMYYKNGITRVVHGGSACNDNYTTRWL